MRISAGIAIALLWTACGKGGPSGPSPMKMVEEKQAEMAKFLEPVRAKVLGNDLPMLTTDGITGLKGPLLTWLRPNGNAVVLSEEKIRQMKKDGDDPSTFHEKTHDGTSMDKFELFGTIDFGALTDWVVGKTFANFHPVDMKSHEQAETLLDHYFGLQYVIVVRIFTYVAPVITSSDSTTDTAKFTAGKIVGEARVLDLKGGDHGGFRFVVGNSENITATSGDENEAFAADLEDNLRKQFDAGLQQVAPKSSSLGDFIMLH